MSTRITATGLPPARDLVDGVRTPVDGHLEGDLADASTGRPLQPRAASSSSRVDAAVAAAARAHGSGEWQALGPDGRAAVLRDLAARIDVRREAMAVADALTTGVPITVTRMFAASLAGIVERVADLATSGLLERRHPGPGGRDVVLHRLGWGPAALITPWNAPTAVGLSKIANALAVGCPAVVKPSEWAHSSLDLLFDAVEEVDLPPGVLQLVHGDGRVGAQLVGDRRIAMVSFTGSQAVGRAIAAAAAPRFAPLQLELGGANPVIVRGDADVAATAQALAAGVTKLNGQWCEAPRRVLADRAIHDDLVDALLAAFGQVRTGHALEESTTLGPLAYRAHRDRVVGAVRSAVGTGGEAVTAGDDVPDVGWFVPPTLVRGSAPEDALDEVFGPVLFLHAVDGDDAALHAANLGADGLAAYVFTADLEGGMALGARIRAGEVKVNGTSVLDLVDASAQSFWGASGIGGHGAVDVLEAYGGLRIVGVDHPDAPI